MAERIFFVLGSLFALVGVAAGAFGAHALRGVVAADLLAVFETAVRYQLVHALALLAAALAAMRWPGRVATAAGASSPPVSCCSAAVCICSH